MKYLGPKELEGITKVYERAKELYKNEEVDPGQLTIDIMMPYESLFNSCAGMYKDGVIYNAINPADTSYRHFRKMAGPLGFRSWLRREPARDFFEMKKKDNFNEVYLNLAKQYIETQPRVLSNAVHEMSHKIFQDNFLMSLDEDIADVLKTLDFSEEILNYNSGIYHHVFRKKKSAIINSLGLDAAKRFATYAKARGVDENIARAMEFKLTGRKNSYNTFSLFNYALDNVAVQCCKPGDFLDYSYRELIDMQTDILDFFT